MPAAVLPHFHRVIKAIKMISELQLGMEDLNAAGLVFVLGDDSKFCSSLFGQID